MKNTVFTGAATAIITPFTNNKVDFDAFEKLARVLAVKSTLGIRTREAYLNKDKEKLREIIQDYETVYIRLKEFHAAHRDRWFKDNKPHGFDIQDIRLGGAMQRVLSCKERLEDYINGTVDRIPELEEPVLEQINGLNLWPRIVSANTIGHEF